jgi:hypothetical protein
MTTETTLYWFSIEIYFHSDMHTDVTHVRTSEFEWYAHTTHARMHTHVGPTKDLDWHVNRL